MNPVQPSLPAVRNSRIWMFCGIGVSLLGIVAIATPLVAGIAMTFAVGAFLICSGMIHLLQASRLRPLNGPFLPFLSAMIFVVCGGLMVLHPLLGLNFLTLMLSVYFLSQGLLFIVGAFARKGGERWRLFLNGVLEIVLAAVVFYQWPLSGAWAVGILVGTHLLLRGMWMTALGSKAQQIAEVLTQPIAVE